MRCFLVMLVASLAAPPLLSQPRAVQTPRGMVVSVSPPATEVGIAVLKKGGTAVDATVATAFALAVTYPAAGNIGGGGFMLVHPPSGKPLVFDYREMAPAAATRTMFTEQKNSQRHNVVGVPGTVRGMELAHRKFGKLPWKDLVLPAVELAEKGFVLDQHMADSLNELLRTSKDFAELARVFGKPGGKESWRLGDRLTQPDLAKTLRQIAEGGPEAFYAGTIADLLIAEMNRGKGLITKADLANYAAREREPIHGTYRGYDVYGPPPPSSGGVALVQMLNVLENFDLKAQGRFSTTTLHQMAESMRRAFHDRAKHLGDPEFVKLPPHLTSKDYAKELAKGIDAARATPSVELAKEIPLTGESDDTTHFSVVDADGMAVSNTYTLEASFGSKIVVRGAGFLLNNEMGDFNWKPGVTDRKGRIGTEPNVVAPGKRMLSSMTPTILAKGGRVVLDVQHAVDAPRMHQQWFPDELLLEQFSSNADVMKDLEKLGHKIRMQKKQGDGHSIWIDPKTGTRHGAADRRLIGKALGY